nr:MAG TPA: hypothetical protein [Bacteriophage sp.]
MNHDAVKRKKRSTSVRYMDLSFSCNQSGSFSMLEKRHTKTYKAVFVWVLVSKRSQEWQFYKNFWRVLL